ncbi:exported hypothetical protein [Candidatus Sulfopaludibacter sp. SbA3]|nr:exported hypothetical protein [Candidatus Sulfopaludibacter sp. SbA3]
MKAKLIGGLLVVSILVVVASGQNRPDPGGWHGTRWGMAEAEVRGIFQDKLTLCSGWPPPRDPPIPLKEVDCFAVDDQQVGSHRYAVTFEPVGTALEEALRTAERFSAGGIQETRKDFCGSGNRATPRRAEAPSDY